MRDRKLILCAALFLLLTALRLLYPAQAARTQAMAAAALDPRGRCREAALLLGRELEDFHPRDRLTEAFSRREGAGA